MTSASDFHASCFSNPVLYQTFDESGMPILPCGKSHCVTKEGKPYVPAATVCAHAKCGKRFRSPCPGIIFCCKECFEATGTQAQWEEAVKAKLEHKRRLAKARKAKYLQSEKGKRTKSEQNKRCYQTRKEQGKPQAAYARQKALRQADLPKPLAVSHEKPDMIPCAARH